MPSTFIPPIPPCMHDSTRTRVNKMRKYTVKLVGLWELGRRKVRKLFGSHRWFNGGRRESPCLRIPDGSAESIVAVTRRGSFSSVGTGSKIKLCVVNPDLPPESEGSLPPAPSSVGSGSRRLHEGTRRASQEGESSMRSTVPRKPVPIQQIRPGTANSLKSEDGHSLRRKPASSDLRHSDLQTVQARVQRVPERPSTHLASALASGSSHAPAEFEAPSFSARVGSRPGTENPRNLSAEFWDRRAGPRIPSSPLAPLADSVKGAVPEGRQMVSRSRAQSQASPSRGPYMPAASTSARSYESSNSSTDSLYNETQAQAEWELIEMGAHEVLTSLPVQRL